MKKRGLNLLDEFDVNNTYSEKADIIVKIIY